MGSRLSGGYKALSPVRRGRIHKPLVFLFPEKGRKTLASAFFADACFMSIFSMDSK
jgi:hypothetical protein